MGDFWQVLGMFIDFFGFFPHPVSLWLFIYLFLFLSFLNLLVELCFCGAKIVSLLLFFLSKESLKNETIIMIWSCRYADLRSINLKACLHCLLPSIYVTCFKFYVVIVFTMCGEVVFQILFILFGTWEFSSPRILTVRLSLLVWLCIMVWMASASFFFF